MAYTSAPTSLESKKWDVFIIFRGEDIDRQGFLADLCGEMKEHKHINFFVDDKLETGDVIPNDLWKALDESHVVVVIFSLHFANSSFCLDEIVRISKRSKTIVIPVFYKVTTDDVQGLKGSFGENFKKLKKRNRRWITALNRISSIKGLDWKNYNTDYKLIKAIVQDVSKKLSELPIVDHSCHDIGIETRVEEVKTLLNIELSPENDDVRMIGMYGLPGIGKTTLAKKVYHEVMSEFDSHCFVYDVKEELKRITPSNLRDKIMEKLNSKNDRMLRGRKVLIVLDGVEDLEHLKILVGECSLYRKGSRILVTSIDKQVLDKVIDFKKFMYEVKELDDEVALQVFWFYAFEVKQSHPNQELVKLSKKFIRYAQGLPLALEVLGSRLSSLTTIDYWKYELKALKRIPDSRVVNVLKRSYQGLNRNEKDIFLDIACFFRGESKDRVERILEGCEFFPRCGMRRLVEKSLIFISADNKVDMHDLIQQMGQEIVEEECKQHGEHSRLSKYKDVFNVMTKDAGTEKIEGILLDQFEEHNLELSPTVFKKMDNLRILKVYGKRFVSRIPEGLEFLPDDFNYWSLCGIKVLGLLSWRSLKILMENGKRSAQVLLPKGLEFLPEELRYLYWSYYPLKSLPLNFIPRNLVELCMRFSSLEILSNKNAPLENLRYMDLSFSKNLISIPDLASVPNLEFLNLTGCVSLKEISLSPKKFYKLKYLICHLCKNLKIPENIGSLTQLEELDLSRNEVLESLPASIKQLSKLRILATGYCSNLKFFPELPNSLKCLHAGYCTSLKSASTSFLSAQVYCDINFANCISLDKDVCTRLVDDVLEMHVAKQEIKLCIMGDELPESEKLEQSTGSCLSLPLKHMLMGISLCIVLDSGLQNNIVKMTFVECKANFKDESGQEFQFVFHWEKPYYIVASNSRHILMWYEPFDKNKYFVEASFEFFAPKSYLPEMEINIQASDEKEEWYFVSKHESKPIIACGVHPIYHWIHSGTEPQQC